MIAEETITVYSTHCPKCEELEKKLLSKRLLFEVVDDMDKVLEQAKKHNIQLVPFVIVDKGFATEKVLDFNQAVEYFSL